MAVIAQVVRNTGRAATTTAICATMAWTIPESTTRYWLRQGETKGFFYRTSERGGWRVCPAGGRPATAYKPVPMYQRWTPATKQRELPLLVEVKPAPPMPKVQQARRVVTTADAPKQLALAFAAAG